MRKRLLIPFLLLSVPAAAQVTIDPRALDPLAPTPVSPVRPAPKKPLPKRPPPIHATAHPVPPKSAPPARPATAPVPPPAVPIAPPPTITLPPPIVVPMRPAAPATPAPISADAPGTAEPLPGGLRLTFGAGRADLNPAGEASLRALVRPPASGASYSLTSYAAGTPEDPSTARRLSLSRALTVRSVLISAGAASVHIYVRALGPASPGFADGPADRCDVIVAADPLPAGTTAAPLPTGTTAAPLQGKPSPPSTTIVRPRSP